MIYEVGLFDTDDKTRHPLAGLAQLVKRKRALAFYAKVRPPIGHGRTMFRLVDGDGTIHLASEGVAGDGQNVVISASVPQLHEGTPYALVVELEPHAKLAGYMRVALPAFKLREP